MGESGTASSCPSEELLLDVARARTKLREQPSLEAHLARCSACRGALAALLAANRSSPLASDARDESPVPGAAPVTGMLVARRYRLVRVIGIGGSGVVWEGRDEHTGARVALKILRSVSEEAARRQRREARIAQALEHPSIVRVLDVVDLGAAPSAAPVLVMPLLDGESLETLLAREGKLGPARVAALLVPMLDALAHAHERGVVHRDVKPANVFVSDDGVRVLDFGVAQLVATDGGAVSQITVTGEVLGTPRYMAPEQLFAERDLDQRVDVWAAAIVTYRALTGEHAIAASTLGDTYRAVARGTIVPIATRAPGLPRAVVEAVEQALVTDRQRRSATVLGLRRALADVVAF